MAEEAAAVAVRVGACLEEEADDGQLPEAAAAGALPVAGPRPWHEGRRRCVVHCVRQRGSVAL